MSTISASGEHRYRVVNNWAKPPDGWWLTDVASTAVDSKDRIDVFNRGDHPMVMLDRDCNFIEELGAKAGSAAPTGWQSTPTTISIGTDDGDDRAQMHHRVRGRRRRSAFRTSRRRS